MFRIWSIDLKRASCINMILKTTSNLSRKPIEFVLKKRKKVISIVDM